MDNRLTFGASFNRTTPEDAAVIAWLEPLGKGQRSDAIKAALRAYVEQGHQPPAITEQELAELRAELAWHRQNQDAAAVIMTVAAQAVSTETPEQSTAPSGPALSPVFLAAVRKAARPGIRLGD